MTRPLRQVLAETQSVPLEIGWLPETKTTAPTLPPEEVPAAVTRGSGVALDLTGVGKSFGDKRVLGGVDLQVRPGGCGKSTLLRLLVGLDRPSEGEIAIGPGRDGGKANARIVFQEPRLLPWASVLDNVAVGLPASLSPEAAWKAAETVLADVHLQGRADDWPSVLSGGQRQRVALARALVSHPDLLVLDEPLGALDALTRITMQSLIERVWHAQGFTAVLVTHDVAEAVALGDRVVVIDDGRIVLDLAIDLPRPRERGSAALAALEGKLLDAIFGVAEVVY
jgi:sulfonate transport system ATP-binding protein